MLNGMIHLMCLIGAGMRYFYANTAIQKKP